MQPETPELQPSSEGAALIAATEQETAQPAVPAEWVPMIDVLAKQADAWEATARLACARVDELLAQVQATTHGEAGETQNGVQGADWTATEGLGSNTSPRFLDLVGEVERLIRGDSNALLAGRADSTARLIMAQLAHKHGLWPVDDSTPPPAVQGAGRNWYLEITSALEQQTALGWLPRKRVAEVLIPALGLHDLEQAAAVNALALSETRSTAMRKINALEASVRAGDAQLDEARTDRDAARRELEQLRGEVERIRVDLPAIAGRQPGAWGVANELDGLLRAALAAAAPATQDGDTNG